MKKSGMIKKILNVMFYIVLLFMLFISTTLIIAKVNGKQPSILGNKLYIVLSGSMAPKLKVGDLVVVKEIDPEKIRIGDIITFKVEGTDTIVTHRVKDIYKNKGYKYITKGDANNTEDLNVVDESNIIGKVVNDIPKLGTIIQKVNNNIYYILAIIVVLAVMVSILVGIKNKKEETVGK